jgi:hypothetical protein
MSITLVELASGAAQSKTPTAEQDRIAAILAA